MPRHAGGLIAACFLVVGIAGQAAEPVFNSIAEAESHYRSRLVEHPDLPLPRLELARLYFLQGRDALAREHFERVLASDPPPQVVANINRFLAAIKARRKWSASAGFSITRESNLEGQSEARTVRHDCSKLAPANPLRLVCRNGVAEGKITGNAETSGIGVRAWAEGEYQHPVSNRARLRLGGRVDRTEYGNRRFDKMTLAIHAGPRLFLTRNTEISALAVGRRHWESGKAAYRDLGMRIETRHRLNQRTVIAGRLSRIERVHATQSRYDGPLSSASISVDRLLSPALRGGLWLGLSSERPYQINRRNAGRLVGLSLSALLPGGFTVGGTATAEWKNWKGTDRLVFDGGNRKDRTTTIQLRVHKRDLTILGFSPELSATREERVSNSQLSDYRSLSGGLNFVRPF